MRHLSTTRAPTLHTLPTALRKERVTRLADYGSETSERLDFLAGGIAEDSIATGERLDSLEARVEALGEAVAGLNHTTSQLGGRDLTR